MEDDKDDDGLTVLLLLLLFVPEEEEEEDEFPRFTTSQTVKDVPSMAINPFGTIYLYIDSSIPILIHNESPSFHVA